MHVGHLTVDHVCWNYRLSRCLWLSEMYSETGLYLLEEIMFM